MLQRKRNIHSVYGSLSNFYFQQLIEPKYFSSMGFPGDSVVKNPPANAGDLDSIPGLGRSPGKGNGNPLQDSCLEIPRTEEPGRLQSMGSQRVND